LAVFLLVVFSPVDSSEVEIMHSCISTDAHITWGSTDINMNTQRFKCCDIDTDGFQKSISDISIDTFAPLLPTVVTCS